MNRSLPCVLVVALLTGLGCGASRSGTHLVRTLQASPPASFKGEILDLRRGEFADRAALRRAIERADVIYLGEYHDSPEQHAFQAEIVRMTYEVDPLMAVGFEMFFQPYQNWLDLYIAGEIEEEEMLRRTQFFTRWGWGWTWYAPVWQFAREKGIPLIALNVPKEITRAVARGGLESLTEAQRSDLPELDLTNARHREAFEDAMHGHGEGQPEVMNRFYTAQTIWDEGMAEAIAAFRAGADGKRRVVVLAGSRHVDSGLGIPSRVRRRERRVKNLLIVPHTVANGVDPDWDALLASDRGHFAFLSPEGTGGTGSLGLQLDRNADVDDEGLEVQGVAPNGAADLAKIRKGDRIRSVDGKSVTDFTSLGMALGVLTPGRRLVFRLRRGEHDVETEVTVAARTFGPATPPKAPEKGPEKK